VRELEKRMHGCSPFLGKSYSYLAGGRGSRGGRGIAFNRKPRYARRMGTLYYGDNLDILRLNNKHIAAARSTMATAPRRNCL